MNERLAALKAQIGFEPPDDAKAEWLAWMAERPPSMQESMGHLRPWKVYQNTDTKQLMALESLFEDSTVRAVVVYGYNLGVSVFGIPVAELEEWDGSEDGLPEHWGYL